MADETPIVAVEGRTCGDCSLCCKLLNVGKPGEAFQKPQNKWCHLIRGDKHGCTVHDHKPPPCEEFKCLWLSGALAEEDRPDKSRLVVVLEDSIGDEGLTNWRGQRVVEPTPVWCVYEREPGAAFEKRAARIMDDLRSMVIRQDGDDRFQGPFPVLVIPSPTHTRLIRLPGMTRWIKCYRPGGTPDE